MAALGIPACGYGIRYDHGLFRQVIKDGWQQEYPEHWLSFGNPWEFERPEVIYDILYGGRVEPRRRRPGGRGRSGIPAETIQAVAYDTPIVGWRGRHVNPLRLWSARAVDPLRLDVFNDGDHVAALSEQSRAEAISKILYPSDGTPAGRELRLRQEYFFVSASLQDLVQRHLRTYGSIYTLPSHAAIQLNDTHPSIAIAELMRILVDVHNVAWDEAWQITRRHSPTPTIRCCRRRWKAGRCRCSSGFCRVISRSSTRSTAVISRRSGNREMPNPSRLAALSLIDEGDGGRVRMGHLAFLGSHRVNGVSALHTELMRRTVFGDFHRLYPDRIVNKTNGITFRRWLHQANPRLTRLLCAACGAEILDDPGRCAGSPIRPTIAGCTIGSPRSSTPTSASSPGSSASGWACGSIPPRCSTCTSSGSTNTSGRLLNLLDTIARYQAIRADPTGTGFRASRSSPARPRPAMRRPS